MKSRTVQNSHRITVLTGLEWLNWWDVVSIYFCTRLLDLIVYVPLVSQNNSLDSGVRSSIVENP